MIQTVSAPRQPDGKTVEVRLDSGKTSLIFGNDAGAMEVGISQQWSLVKGTDECALEGMNVRDERHYPLPHPGITWTEESKSAHILFEYYVETADAVSFLVRVTNFSTEPAALRWWQEIIGLPMSDRMFAPSGRDFYPLAERKVDVGYRDGAEGLSIPIVTFFDERKDTGVTIAANIETPLPPFKVQTSPDSNAVQLTRTVLRLAPGESRTVRHFLLHHAGCWRPGLSWVRDRFHRFFMLPTPQLHDTHGCFTYSNLGAPELCEEFAREGVKNLEVHFNYVHLGKYLPEEEPWIKAVDDKWSAVKRTTDPAAPPEDAPYEEIKRYMSQVVHPNGTTDAVREFIRRLRALGIRSFGYFQPTEAWEFFANPKFPEVILHRPDDAPELTWYDHVVVDCRPETRWGQYLCQQLEGVLDTYPELDGIFMDQAAGDGENYAVSRVTDRLARIAKDRGKLVYWNGPYMVELIEHTMGLLAEGGSIQGEQLKFLTIGDKVCCGMGHSERQYQRNLLNGLWPSAPSLRFESRFRYSDGPAEFVPVPDEVMELHRRYMNLFELYVGKTWVLEPHAIKTPAGVQGNIFRRPDGDYLVPLIAPARSSEGGGFEENVQVTVHASGAEQVRGVYVRTPDAPMAQFAAEWTRDGNEIRITIPWLGSACLLWLASEEQTAGEAPTPPEAKAESGKPSTPKAMAAYITLEGAIPTGSPHGPMGGLVTTAPLPPIPERKVRLNGCMVGPLHSRNYRSWHPLLGIGLPEDILGHLGTENELVIEPDGPEDFFKIRNIQMTVMLPDGRIMMSERVTDTFSSCEHPMAEGAIGSPMKIKLRMPDMDK